MGLVVLKEEGKWCYWVQERRGLGLGFCEQRVLCCWSEEERLGPVCGRKACVLGLREKRAVSWIRGGGGSVFSFGEGGGGKEGFVFWVRERRVLGPVWERKACVLGLMEEGLCLGLRRRGLGSCLREEAVAPKQVQPCRIQEVQGGCCPHRLYKLGLEALITGEQLGGKPGPDLEAVAEAWNPVPQEFCDEPHFICEDMSRTDVCQGRLGKMPTAKTHLPRPSPWQWGVGTVWPPLPMPESSPPTRKLLVVGGRCLPHAVPTAASASGAPGTGLPAWLCRSLPFPGKAACLSFPSVMPTISSGP